MVTSHHCVTVISPAKNVQQNRAVLDYLNVYGGISHCGASEFRRGMMTDELMLLQQLPAHAELVLPIQYSTAV